MPLQTDGPMPVADGWHEAWVRVVDLGPHTVELTARSSLVCRGCTMRGACGHGLLDGLRRGRQFTLTLPRTAVPADVVVGDVLLLGVAPGAILGSAARVYGLPLFGFVAGAGLTAGNDPLPLLGAVCGAVLGWLGARLLEKRRLDTRLRCRRAPEALSAGRSCEDEPRPLQMV